jgi:parallel beta-helix repeat protein
MKKFFLSIMLAILLFASPAFAADHYVNCADIGGNDDGHSAANAFISIAQANAHSYAAGDDLYFFEGSTCDMVENLYIDWSGVDGDNYAIIGCYDGEGDFDCDGARPILDGDDDVGVSGTWGFLIYTPTDGSKGDYVHIKDLEVRESYYGCIGVGPHGAAASGTYDEYVIAENLKIEQCSGNGLSFFRIKNGQIKDSIFTDAAGYGASFAYACINVTALASASKPNHVGDSDSNVVSGNIVSRCRSEGIDLIRGTTNSIAEYNVVYDNNTPGIYLSNSKDNIARYNLVYTSSDGDTGGGRQAYGIAIQNEDTVRHAPDKGLGSGHQIYGNIIAGNDNGIYMASAAGTAENNLIYNNTLIDNGNNFWFEPANSAGDTGNLVKNNISWTITGGLNHVNACSPTGVTFDYNLWDDDPGTGNCDAANDPANASPLLSKTSGWRAITAGALNIADFAPTEGSPAIDVAVDLTSYDTIIISGDATASPPTVTTGDQNDYGPPGQATLQAEPDAEDLNPTLETNAYVQPTAGSQSHDIGAVLASKDHSYTIWRLAEGDGVGDECDPTPTWTWETKSYSDLLAHTFSGLSASTIYCWQAVFGNVAGDGVASAIDEFSTTGSAVGVEITISITADKKVTFTLDTIGNKKATVTIRP